MIACGGREIHRVFTGNDLPGVLLARGAARLAGVHGVQPGTRAVVWAEQPEALEHARTLAKAGVEIAAVVAPEGLDTSGVEAEVVRGEVTAAAGKKRLKGVVDRAVGTGRSLRPARRRRGDPQANDAPAPARLRPAGVAAGECRRPGARWTTRGAAAQRAGHRRRRRLRPLAVPPKLRRSVRRERHRLPVRGRRRQTSSRRSQEGFDSAELLKRYTTVDDGPVPGAALRRPVRAVAARHARRDRARRRSATTPPPAHARPITLEEAAAGAVRHDATGTRRCTRRHLAPARRRMWAGAVEARRGTTATSQAEYWAVRQRVGVIDVGTLGKFLVAGPDATEFLERRLPDARRRPRAWPPALRRCCSRRAASSSTTAPSARSATAAAT